MGLVVVATARWLCPDSLRGSVEKKKSNAESQAVESFN